MNKNQTIIAVVLAVVILLSSIFIAVPNKAIGLEEDIATSKSGIQIQENRQHDLIKQLVQVVEALSSFEANTQTSIAELRSAAETGDVAQAMTAINAVAEAYPDLKSNEAYLQLMTEMAISENLKKQYREAYNDDVRKYRTFVRKFPNRGILAFTGYEVLEFSYLEFEEVEIPDTLFTK
jgi:LemA protein